MKRDDINVKKSFAKKALPDFKIHQSRFIQIKGEKYAVVGQQSLETFLYSHYDVFDQYGNRADDDQRAKAIYRYIAMFQVAQLMQMIQVLLDDQEEVEIDHDSPIAQDFAEKHDTDINWLLRGNESISNLLQILIDEAKRISDIDGAWHLDQLHSFQHAWDAAWGEYGQRLETLFQFHTYIWENNLNVDIQETYLHDLYKEANLMAEFFSESLPADRPVVTDIDDLIQLAGDLGRTPAEEGQKNLLTGFERFSMHFFKYAYRIPLFLFFPVSLLISVFGWVDGDLLYQLPLASLGLTVLFFTAHITDQHARKTKMMRRLKENREEALAQHPLISTTYQTRYKRLEDLKQQAVDESYAFVATPTALWRLLLGAGIIISLLGLALQNTDSQEYSTGYLLVGGSLLLLRFVLPMFGIANIRFQLLPDGMQRGKRAKIYPRDIFELGVSRNGHIFALNLGHQQRQKFRIRPAYRKDAKEQLKIWCDKHSIRYKGKLYF